MTSELGTFLGKQTQDINRSSATQGINPGIISSYFVFADYKFKIKVTKVIVEEQSISPDAMIWGTGIWGAKEWADEEGAFSEFEIIEQKILTQSIPDIAREEIITWLAGDVTAKAPQYISVGDGNKIYVSTDTALDNELARKIVVADITETKKAKYILELTSADAAFQGKTLREVGLGTASDTGINIIIDDFSTTDNKDIINTTAIWGGTGSIIF